MVSISHEVGHYYWDALIQDASVLDGLHVRFGDDREVYTAVLQRYYEHGPAPHWQSRFASAHPWEDWAET